jgi:hypothetical protein
MRALAWVVWVLAIPTIGTGAILLPFPPLVARALRGWER